MPWPWGHVALHSVAFSGSIAGTILELILIKKRLIWSKMGQLLVQTFATLCNMSIGIVVAMENNKNYTLFRSL